MAIEICYDEIKGLSIAKALEEYLNAGWEILNIQPVRDEELLVYAIIFKREKK